MPATRTAPVPVGRAGPAGTLPRAVRTRRAPAPPRTFAVSAVSAVLALALVAGLSACSDDDDDAGPTTAATGAGDGRVADPTAIPQGAIPADSLEAAVTTLLTAEQAGDHATSYALLSAISRAEFTSPADWERRRSQLPAMTGFRVERADDAGVVALVEHQPGLDPFVGLSATERQTWTGVRTRLGWLVDAEPDRQYVLPPDDGVAAGATTWLQAVQRCDEAAAGAAQAVTELFGDLAKADGLCGATGDVVTGAVGSLEAGPASSDIVAQYTTDALAWSRVVRVSAPVALGVVMAPIGSEWKVLGITA
jgi:hypothetical protein